MKDMEIPVIGMGCEHCVTKISKEMSRLAGVARAEVDLGRACMRVVFHPDKTDLALIRAAVQKAGYDLDLRALDVNAESPQPGHDCSGKLPIQ